MTILSFRKSDTFANSSDRPPFELEEQPANVRVEKAFRDVVGIFVVIYMLVMGAMLAGPHESRIFKGPRAEKEPTRARTTGCPWNARWENMR